MLLEAKQSVKKCHGLFEWSPFNYASNDQDDK